jgi:hypothetical protein
LIDLLGPDQLTDDFFNARLAESQKTVLHAIANPAYSFNAAQAVLARAPADLFFVKDKAGNPPLIYIIKNCYSTEKALALLEAMPKDAYTIEWGKGINLFHCKFDENVSELVINKIFDKAPVELLMKKDKEGSAPIHRIGPFYNKLLSAAPKEAFYLKNQHGYSIMGFFPSLYMSLEQLEAIIRAAPLTSFFQQQPDGRSALYRIIDSRRFTTANKASKKLYQALLSVVNMPISSEDLEIDDVPNELWRSLLSRLENSSREDFLEKDFEGETFLSRLMNELEHGAFNIILRTYQQHEKFFSIVLNKIGKDSLLSHPASFSFQEIQSL